MLARGGRHVACYLLLSSESWDRNREVDRKGGPDQRPERRPDKRLLQHHLELVAGLGAAGVVFSRKAENMDFLGWVLAQVSSE